MEIIHIIIQKRSEGTLDDNQQVVFSTINSLAFQIIYNYLLGSSQKNRLYCCRYFDLMHRNIALVKDEGKSVMLTLNQLTENIHTLIRGTIIQNDDLKERVILVQN